jgi:two-component system sensor histidine kinase AlgZ
MPPNDEKTAQYTGETVGQTAGQSAPLGAGQQPATPRARRQSEGAAAPLVPDTCNMGIALRTLAMVNAVAAVWVLVLSGGVMDALWRALSVAALVEPAVIGSLASLCLARKWSNGKPLWVQWAVGVLVPVAVVLLVLLMARAVPGSEAAGAGAWWFVTRALMAAAAAAAVLEDFRLRARAYSPSFSEARLQALQARIRPHFLFNSLNAVLGLMRSDPRRAEATLENLADLFRVFMRDARDLVALDDEVITCKEYLAIEQLRLGERLKVVWHLDDMPGDALLPSLLLQPLIENAVHHGIEPSSQTGTIEIAAARTGDRVRVEIINPIPDALPTRAGNQMGLSNVRERLMLLYDMEAELKTRAEASVFRLELEFPYRKERRRRDVRRHFDTDR